MNNITVHVHVCIHSSDDHIIHSTNLFGPSWPKIKQLCMMMIPQYKCTCIFHMKFQICSIYMYIKTSILICIYEWVKWFIKKRRTLHLPLNLLASESDTSLGTEVPSLQDSSSDWLLLNRVCDKCSTAEIFRTIWH